MQEKNFIFLLLGAPSRRHRLDPVAQVKALHEAVKVDKLVRRSQLRIRRLRQRDLGQFLGNIFERRAFKLWMASPTYAGSAASYSSASVPAGMGSPSSRAMASTTGTSVAYPLLT